MRASNLVPEADVDVGADPVSNVAGRTTYPAAGGARPVTNPVDSIIGVIANPPSCIQSALGEPAPCSRAAYHHNTACSGPKTAGAYCDKATADSTEGCPTEAASGDCGRPNDRFARTPTLFQLIPKFKSGTQSKQATTQNSCSSRAQ
jgi:hypothetical protein